MSDFTFNGTSYTEDEVKGAASGLGLSLDDYLTQYSDVQKVEAPDPENEKTGGEGQNTIMGNFLEVTADFIGMGAELAAKAMPGPITGFLGMLIDGSAISRGLKGNNIDLIEATNNLKNAEEITPELLDAFVNEAKESNKNAEKLTELQGFVESFDKEMEDSGNPIMATVEGMKGSGGLGAFQSVMAQSIAGLLSPSAMGYGAAAAGPGALIGSKIPVIGTIAGGFGAYSAFANAHVENMVTFSSAVQEELQFRNMDFTSDNVRKLFQDKDAIRRMELTAIKRGATIGTIEGLGSLAAIRGGSAVNKALRARGKSKTIGALGGLGTAVTAEMAAGGLGEAAGLTVEGKPLVASEIVLEAISGPFSSAPITVLPQAYNVLKKPVYKINGKPIKEAVFRDIIENSTPEELAGIDFEVEGDSYLNNLKNDKQLEADILGDIKSRVTDKADQQKIVQLEKERLKYKDSKTKTAKNFRNKIDEQIKEITDKYAQTGRKNKATLDFEAQQQKIKDAKGKRNVASTVRFFEEEGGKFGYESRVYDTNEEIAEALRSAGATEEQINQFFEDSKKNSIGGGIFNNIAYINRTEAAKTGQINVGAHEILHGILNNVVGDDAAQAKLVENFKKVLTKSQKKKIENELKTNGVDPSQYNTEYITTFADLIRETKNENHISFDDGIMNKVNNVLSDVFKGTFGIGTIGFADGRQTYNFLREYNKSIEKGKISESISNLYTPEQQTSAFERANSQKSIPEKSLSDLAKDYQTNPAEADIESLLTQYYSTGIDALVRWGASGKRNVPIRDVLKDEEKRNEIQSLLNSQFNSFIKNFKGDLSEATTYMNNIAKRVGPAIMEFIEEGKIGRLEDNTKETESKVDVESSIEEVVPTINPIIDLILEDKNLNINELFQEYLNNLDKVDLTNYKTASDASPTTTQKIFGETEKQELKTFKEKDETIYNLFPENQRRNTKGTTKSATGLKPSIRNSFYVKGERADMTAGTAAGNPIQAKIPFDKFIPALEKFDSKDHGKTIKQKFGELSGTIGPKNRNQKTFRAAVKAEIGKAITLYVARINESNEQIASDMADGKSPMSYSKRPKIKTVNTKKNQALFRNETNQTEQQIHDLYVNPKFWYKVTAENIDKYVADIKTIVDILEERNIWPKDFLSMSMAKAIEDMPGKANSENRALLAKKLKEIGLGISSRSQTKAAIKYGTNPKSSIFKKILNKISFEKYNKINNENFEMFWRGINYIVNEEPRLAAAVFHMLKHTQNERSHHHSNGAAVTYVNFDALKVKWEHALQNTNAYRWLMDSALDPSRNFDKDFKVLKANYQLWAIDEINDNKLDKAKLKNQMSSELFAQDTWSVEEDYAWQRYFNYVVAQIDGGINPSKLINPLTGKSAMQELGVNEMGEPTTAQLMKFENSANSKNVYSKRKKADNINKAKELDAEVNDLQKKHYSGKNLEKEFNDIIAMKTGIKSEARFKKATAQIRGEKKGKGLLNMLIPPRMQDFMGLMYNIIGAGKFGQAQKQWFEDNFSRPYAKAMNDFASARVALMEDFKALKDSLGIIPKNLKELVPDTIYTQEHAVRVYAWTKMGFEIPDISKKDHKALIKFIKNNPQLEAFANKLIEIQKESKYVKPSESWMAGGIVPDLLENLNTVTRKKYLQQWQDNVDKVFTKETLNKLEAAFGKQYRRALEESLRRMSTGINKRQNRDPYIGKFVDWLNGSIGVIMFFNTRSALLQTISMANFVNHTDNNIFAAAKAFANQKQFWSDFMMLFNSDFLKDRRGGLRINVNEADIAEMAKKQGASGVIHKLLQFGFLPTQIADSFAIASGGASFYRNRVNKYIKDGMSQKDAESQAFQDFRENAEESQQSSRADKISQEQAGDLGRLILAFGNTPSQYFRIMNKQYRDIKNKRRIKGLTLPQSQIARAQVLLYYLVVQNIIFNAMQQALFALGFEDEEDEKLIKDKAFATANGMADSVLRGMGIVGAGISTIKNAGLKIHGELGKSRPNYEKAVDELLNISPPIDSKITRLKSAARTFQWQQKAIKNKGISMDNPALMAVAQTIAAATNIPLDRGLRKFDNVTTAFEQDLDFWQRLALLGGWSDWQIGIEDESEYAKTKFSKSKIKKKKIKKNPRIK